MDNTFYGSFMTNDDLKTDSPFVINYVDDNEVKKQLLLDYYNESQRNDIHNGILSFVMANPSGGFSCDCAVSHSTSLKSLIGNLIFIKLRVGDYCVVSTRFRVKDEVEYSGSECNFYYKCSHDECDYDGPGYGG